MQHCGLLGVGVYFFMCCLIVCACPSGLVYTIVLIEQLLRACLKPSDRITRHAEDTEVVTRSGEQAPYAEVVESEAQVCLNMIIVGNGI